MIQLDGCIWKDGGFWLAEVPALDLVTQGNSKRDAIIMLKDAIRMLTGAGGLNIDILSGNSSEILVRTSNEDDIIALMLRRQRQRFGLTLKQLSQRLGSTSPNAFARYEQGRARPSIRKLGELLQAVDKALVITIKI